MNWSVESMCAQTNSSTFPERSTFDQLRNDRGKEEKNTQRERERKSFVNKNIVLIVDCFIGLVYVWYRICYARARVVIRKHIAFIWLKLVSFWRQQQQKSTHSRFDASIMSSVPTSEWRRFVCFYFKLHCTIKLLRVCAEHAQALNSSILYRKRQHCLKYALTRSKIIQTVDIYEVSLSPFSSSSSPPSSSLSSSL